MAAKDKVLGHIPGEEEEMIFIVTIFISNKCFEGLPCQKISKTLRR